MNFTRNNPVWLTRNGKRFRAVATEGPGDETVYTFEFEITKELVNELTDDEFNRVNTLNDSTSAGVAFLKNTERIGYAFFGNDGYELNFVDGQHVREDGTIVEDTDLLWDGFTVSHREVVITPGDMSNHENYTETDTGETWKVYGSSTNTGTGLNCLVPNSRVILIDHEEITRVETIREYCVWAVVGDDHVILQYDGAENAEPGNMMVAERGSERDFWWICSMEYTFYYAHDPSEAHRLINNDD